MWPYEGGHWVRELTRHNDPRTLGKVRRFSDIVAGFSKIRETFLCEIAAKDAPVNRNSILHNELRFSIRERPHG